MIPIPLTLIFVGAVFGAGVKERISKIPTASVGGSESSTTRYYTVGVARSLYTSSTSGQAYRYSYNHGGEELDERGILRKDSKSTKPPEIKAVKKYANNERALHAEAIYEHRKGKHGGSKRKHSSDSSESDYSYENGEEYDSDSDEDSSEGYAVEEDARSKSKKLGNRSRRKGVSGLRGSGPSSRKGKKKAYEDSEEYQGSDEGPGNKRRRKAGGSKKGLRVSKALGSSNRKGRRKSSKSERESSSSEEDLSEYSSESKESSGSKNSKLVTN